MLNHPAIAFNMPFEIDERGHIVMDYGARVAWQNGGWCVKLKWQGKRRFFSVYMGRFSVKNNKGHAEALADEINKDIARGTFNPARYQRSKPLHLEQYSETWLVLKEPNLSTATWADYESSFRLHINPVLGDEYLSDINKDKLVKLLNSINRTPKGKKNVMGAMHTLMNDAKESGHVSQMPIFPKFTGRIQVVKPAIEWVEPTEQWDIIEAIPAKHRPIFTFITLTGCRPSEARALQKKYIHHDEIIFAETFGKKGELKEVKGKEIKSFPLTRAIKELLDTMPQNLTPWVFINPTTGKPYSKNINKIFNKAKKRVGIYISLNNFGRHSFAMWMLNNNVPEGMVSRLLRHSDPRMIKRYAEYQTQSLKSTIDKVQQFPSIKKGVQNG